MEVNLQNTEMNLAVQLRQQRAMAQKTERAKVAQAVAARVKTRTTAPRVPPQSAALPDFPITPRTRSAEEEQAASAKYNEHQAEALTANASIGLSPAAERLAANGNIAEATYDSATTEVQGLTQQIREAKTLADAQRLFSRIRAIEDELITDGLSDEDRKRIDQMREMFWQSLITALPALDDFMGGSDFGVGTFTADFIIFVQYVKGLRYAASQEPYTLTNALSPTPFRFMESLTEGGFRGLMKKLDLGAKIWSVFQTGFVFAIGFIILAAVFFAIQCLSGGANSLSSFCLDAGITVLQVSDTINP
ncbi:MAG: hypothetical protein AAB865_01470 [Patescibacteria group bacterium]